MSFPERLKELMRQQTPALSQHALARLVGVSQGAITNWVNGVNKPFGKNLIRLCHALGVRGDWLLHGEGPKWLPKESSAATKIREADPGYSLTEKVQFIEQTGTPEQRELVNGFLEMVRDQIVAPRSGGKRRRS